jgi:hypothetical protein
MSSIEQIGLAEVVIDPKVQRDLSDSRAQRIADDFNEQGFGVPVISRRTDGTLVVIDGQHRIEGARRAGRGNDVVPMEVFNGLTLQEEAALFRYRNSTKQPTPVDTFKVALIERRADEVSIARIIGAYGWRVDTAGSRGTTQAVAALRTVYAKDKDRHGISTGATLDMTVKVLTGAWGTGHNSLAAAVLLGTGAVVFRYSSRLDVPMLSKALELGWTKPENLMTQARSWKDASGGTIENAAANVITNAYNKRVRAEKKKLPDWQSGNAREAADGDAAGTADAGE